MTTIVIVVSTQNSTQANASPNTKRRTRGEGAVYFDATRDRWVGQIWLDGRRRKVSARTKEDASRALGKLLHGDPAERLVDRRLTVAALLADWQTKALANKKRASSTVERHAWACARLSTELAKTKVSTLDAARVEKALAHMADDGLSRASLVEIRGTLRQALDWAQRRRLITYNAAAVAELPADATRARTKRALSPDELSHLFDALAEHPWRAMFALSARAGLRPGEAAGVCVDAVDLSSDPPTVAVVRAVHLERGRPVLAEQLKTRGARRVLAIPRDVADMLRIVVNNSSPPPGGLLFTAHDKGPIWPSTARSELAAACTRAGVPVVTPNELRHSAATHMADRGVSPHIVADVLGHTTTRMVDLVYRHRPPVIRGAE